MRVLNYLFPFLCILFCLSCFDKWDINGKLDGNWRLQKVLFLNHLTNDSIAHKKQDNIFLAFQLKLASLHIKAKHKEETEEFLMRFTHRKDSLIINNIYKHYRTEDIPLSKDTIKETNLPSIGFTNFPIYFQIEKLSEKELSLKNSIVRLYFSRF